MTYNLILKTRAKNSIANAVDFYELRQTQLDIRFLNLLKQYFSRLKTNPFLQSIKFKNFREAYIQEFPYVIIYSIHENEIVIYDIFHTSQHPDKKP